MDKRKGVCLLLALLVAGRVQAGQVLSFDEQGRITASVNDSSTNYTYGKFQTETSGLLYKKLGVKGMSPTDPAVTRTVQGVEQVAAGVAVGRLAFGGGWLGIVAGAVINAVVFAAVALGLDNLVKWLFGSGNSVTATTTGTVAPPDGSFFYFSDTRVWPEKCGQLLEKDFLTDTAAANAELAAGGKSGAPVVCSGVDPAKVVQYILDSCDGNGNCTTHGINPIDGSTINNGLKFQKSFGIPPNLVDAPAGGDGSPVISDYETAVANLPESEKSQPVNPELAADVVNALWQQASQLPGYAGVAYDPSNPVTTQEAADWQAANPAYTPTVGDAVGTGTGSGTQGQTGSGGSVGALPINNSPGSADPTPGVNPGTDTGTEPGDGTSPQDGQCGAPGEPACEVDWGTNPGTPEPTLESTPTIDMILGPIVNMLPGFRSFQLPAHTGTCPVATFSIFGNSYTMDQHCTLFEQNRTAISAAFALVFLLASVFIVLTA
ncbi:hypothetical protein [Paraburkholderia humisilvae]|uniref:TspB protein n=1 Tax=Paraburkholderia humisilvae TaxID=627669 RepID=A0A6J5E9B3_9BURK|nr:hypothetical protein [Paraburkholderia humisilvae]CAB3762447.1 hypothetical protein LMG29542_04360 [Paraburkholderia humisilvae]